MWLRDTWRFRPRRVLIGVSPQLFGPRNLPPKFTEQFKGQVHVQNVSPQLVALKPFLKLTIMPMQRKRPRESRP